MRIGQHTEQAIRHYCLDLNTDIEQLRVLTQDELVELCKSADRPVVTIRTNAAPTLWALYDATPEHLAPFDETELLERVAQLRDDRPFLARLCRAAQAAEPEYSPSPHVEEQLYERGFPPTEDKILMTKFHAAPWEEKAVLARRFRDERYRRLALRLLYIERPDLLKADLRLASERELRNRLMAAADAGTRWRSIPVALREAQILVATNIDPGDLARQLNYVAYLNERAGALSLPLAV